MKILFLDIDGVLLPGELLWSSRNPRALCEDRCLMLRGVLEATGATVVVSSTWRFFPDTHERLSGLFNIHEDWATKRSPVGAGRGAEIDEWLSRHPEVTQYVILDDDSDMLEHQLHRFVHTKFATGLLPQHVEEIRCLMQ
jgi:hypothetical protein